MKKTLQTFRSLNALKACILLLFLFPVTLFSQISLSEETNCGSTPIENSHLLDPFYGNSQALVDILIENGFDVPKTYLNEIDDYSNRSKVPNQRAAALSIKQIPIKAWVWRNNNGTGNFNESEIYTTVDILNDLFSNTNISFFLLCDITYTNNSAYTNNGDTYFDTMTSDYRDADALNVHYIISSNSTWGGKANFPFSPFSNQKYSCVVGNYGTQSTGDILAHEVGHTLGLYHTHHYGRATNHSNNGGCGDCHQESVSRTKRQAFGCTSTYNKLKCDVNGDFLCDTQADPELSNLVVNSLCTYTSSYTDNWGAVWTPDTNNVMSYSRLNCLSSFSPLQVGKMNYYAGPLLNNQPYYSINGANYMCYGQTAQYSVSSMPGVSSYTWETSSNYNIISGQGTNSISIESSNSNGGFVRVTPSCGNLTRTKTLKAIYALDIDGYDQACPDGGTYTYTISPSSSATYNWSIVNGTIQSGQGTNSVDIKLTSNPNDESTLSVYVGNVCSNPIYRQKVIVHGDPPPPAAQCFSFSPVNNIDSGIYNTEVDLAAFTLFPNPAEEEVTIVLPNEGAINVSLRDIYGNVFFEQKEVVANELNVNLSNFKTGVYFVTINDSKNTATKALLVR